MCIVYESTVHICCHGDYWLLVVLMHVSFPYSLSNDDDVSLW